MSRSSHLKVQVTESNAAIRAAQQTMDSADLTWLDDAAGAAAGWALARDAMAFLMETVRHLRPHHVLEFGSGLSTLALALASSAVEPRPTITSLESDPIFRRRTRRLVAERAPRACVDVVSAHLVSRPWYGRHVPVYQFAETAVAGSPPQLIVVDGPPLPLGGREGALLQAVHASERGTVIVLDDANRASEQEALERLHALFGENVEILELDGFTKGLAAIVVQEPIDGPIVPPVRKSR